MSSKTKDKEKYLLQVSKKIEIAIVDLFSNGDRDRDRNFRDRANTLLDRGLGLNLLSVLFYQTKIIWTLIES